jgi:nitroimidazol reductase NimA-like FMN-containing flavoprotein (pyridoxamine 5'-phosphate oxidase superfamily)
MSAPEFTQGPWSLSVARTLAHIRGGLAGEKCVGSVRYKTAEDKANARVIAAAPETHDALNRAHQLLKKARDDAWLDQAIREEIEQFLGDSQ